jgi:hypothetical protein
MSFDPKSFLSNENELHRLHSEGVTEAADLDFKLEGYGGTDSDKIEACRDVASFANAGGPGYLLVGVEERNSVAVAVPGITGTEVQETRLRDVISDRIEPRIDRIVVRTIPLSNGRGVVVIEIPVCELNIYAVRIDKGRYEFWIRRDKKKAELSFGEIQYRLLADIDILRIRRKAEVIPKIEIVTIYPISPPPRYSTFHEFKVNSTDGMSIRLSEQSSNEIVDIPYELIQTIYYSFSHGLWMIYLLQGYHLILEGKHWRVKQKRKI